MSARPLTQDEIDDQLINPEIICPVTGTYCTRAFCDDYGCAYRAGIPWDEYDEALN